MNKLLEPSMNFAVTKGDASQVKFLLDNGYSPNSKDRDKTTPLHIAAFKGRIDICRILLDHGAKINAEDYASRTPVFMAQSQKHTKTVKFLLSRGADPGIETVHGDTPLSLAISQNNTSGARVLISHGAHVGTEESAFKFLGFAVTLGSLEMVKLLVPFCDLPEVDHISKVRPLALAIGFGYLEIAKYLLQNGSSVTERSYETDETGLHIFLRRLRDRSMPAPSLGFFQEMLQLLYEHNFDFGTKCASPSTGESASSFILRKDSLKVEPVTSLLQFNSPPGFKELLLAYGAPYNESNPAFSSFRKADLGSLKGLCRRAVRSFVRSCRTIDKVGSLDLPLCLKHYLLYCDVISVPGIKLTLPLG